MILKLIYLILLILLVAFYNIAPLTMDKSIISILLMIGLLCVVLFFSKREQNFKLKGQFLRHSIFALLGILIVSFQYPLDFVLGNVSSRDLFIWVDSKIVVKSLTLAVIGLLCFLLGYLTYHSKSYKKAILKERPVSVNILNTLAAIVLTIYFLTANPLYLAGYYGRVDVGSTATYANLLFQLLVFASVIQKSRNLLLLENEPHSIKAYIKQIGWPLIILMSIYLLSIIISGDRGPLIIFSLLFISSYFYTTKKKLSLKYALIYLFIGASIITLLGVARSLNKELSFTAKLQRAATIQTTDEGTSILPQTKELAGSIKAQNTAVDYVPEKHDFFYGMFQMRQLTSIIPFFSIFSPIIYKEHDEAKYKASSAFITWISQGDFPTYGNGTTCIADFYLDFGLMGVVLGMFFFGYLMRFSEIKMYTDRLSPLFVHVFVVVYLCYAIYISRNTLFFNLKHVVWIYSILWLNKKLFQKSIAKKFQ